MKKSDTHGGVQGIFILGRLTNNHSNQFNIMRRRIKVSTLLIAFCGSLLLSGCSSAGTPKVGAACKVPFRRDALGGIGTTVLIGPTTDEMNGTAVSMNAKFKRMDRNWLIVQDERGERDMWIPRDMVLWFSVAHE